MRPVNIPVARWEDILQTARGPLGTAEAPSDLAAKFGVQVSEATCPTFLFWKKGERLNKPDVATHIKTAAEFGDWVWPHLQVLSLCHTHTHTHTLVTHNTPCSIWSFPSYHTFSPCSHASPPSLHGGGALDRDTHQAKHLHSPISPSGRTGIFSPWIFDIWDQHLLAPFITANPPPTHTHIY